MATRGLYVQRLESGAIHGVQVRDDVGTEWTVEPGVYINRGYEPPIDTLPDLKDCDQRRTV
ncbi:hypothetical protein JCM10599A_29550 [Paraburkholderia kururiensis]